MRASSVGRQHSDGGSVMSRQFSDGGSERATKSASAVAQEALTAGGALQTVEAREEGAVALKVRRRGWRYCRCCRVVGFKVGGRRLGWGGGGLPRRPLDCICWV